MKTKLWRLLVASLLVLIVSALEITTLAQTSAPPTPSIDLVFGKEFAVRLEEPESSLSFLARFEKELGRTDDYWRDRFGPLRTIDWWRIQERERFSFHEVVAKKGRNAVGRILGVAFEESLPNLFDTDYIDGLVERFEGIFEGSFLNPRERDSSLTSFSEVNRTWIEEVRESKLRYGLRLGSSPYGYVSWSREKYGEEIVQIHLRFQMEDLKRDKISLGIILPLPDDCRVVLAGSFRPTRLGENAGEYNASLRFERVSKSKKSAFFAGVEWGYGVGRRDDEDLFFEDRNKERGFIAEFGYTVRL